MLKAAIGANTALAQLDQAVVSIPNPTVSINSIPILEDQASSEIEKIVTTTDELCYSDDDAHADPPTRETLRYGSALRAGFDHTLDRGLTTATAAKDRPRSPLHQRGVSSTSRAARALTA